MKKFVVWILMILSLTVLAISFSSKIPEFLGVKNKSGIQITSMPSGAAVLIDGVEVGKTPYLNENLDPKIINVALKKDNISWVGKIRLNKNATSLINRDIATDSASSAGETITLEKGRGITVITNPKEADVEIDGKIIGKSPLNFDLPAGEHHIIVSLSNYLKRSLPVKILQGFNLTVYFDLAISEVDLTQFNAVAVKQTEQIIVKSSVLPNPGFLRIRESAVATSKEVGRAKPGQELILLEDLGKWMRVRLDEEIEGYVSSSFVERKN